jgi:5-formyltetrahydrofolate cyclo-ligase
LSSIAEQKRALRSAVLAARAALSPEARAAASRAIAARVAALPEVARARIVALYAPLGAEVDALALAALLDPAQIAYPRCAAGARRLEFARCDPEALVAGPVGAREPPAACAAVPLAGIDVVVVPGVAFGRDGRRLGRGGGHYDATLAALPHARRVGVAFEVQLVDTVPHEVHDARLDLLATEARLLGFDRPLAGDGLAAPRSP